jgi:hypothetical protein
MIQERLDTYDKDQCWQYDIRVKNLIEDLNECGFTKEYTDTLRVSDFYFGIATTKGEQLAVRKFIERHEWLGKACGFSQYYFTAHHKGVLSGCIVMGTPNAFNLLLGEDYRDLEILINRGACISWSPKNLASSLMSFAINWMVKNTNHRLFTAYSDPTAKELGTIYQACNFYYLGNNFGASKKYIQPYNKGMVSDRWFRTRCAYKNFAKELGIEWDDTWLGKGRRVVWERVPIEIEKKLKDFSKKKQSESEYIEIPSKHKYAYILGRDKKETKQLRKLFEARNRVYPYPKERGK